MSLAGVMLLIGALLWILGLFVGRSYERQRGQMEFWWAVAAFVTGGLGTLAGFGIVPATPDGVTYFRTLPAVTIGVIMVITALVTRREMIYGRGVALLAFFVLQIAFAVSGNEILMPLLSFAIFLPAIVAPRDGYSLDALKSGVRVGTGIVVALIAAAYLLRPSTMIGACRLDKCSVWGLSLGAEGAGNAVGMFLAGAGALCLIMAAGWKSYALIAAGSFLLSDLTSSRSSMNGWWIGFAISLAYWLSVATKRRVWVSLAALGVAAAVAWLPLQPWRADEFTGRAILWQTAQNAFDASPLFGHGSSFWVHGAGVSGVDVNYATHNIFMEIIVSGGIVGLALLIFALIGAARSGGVRPTTYLATAAVGITLALSITEVTSAPGRVYLVPCFMVFAIVVSYAKPKSQPFEELAAEAPSRALART